MSRVLMSCAALLCLAATGVGAQVLRGRVVDEGTSNPVVGALVILADSAGQRIASILTSADGAFQLRARPGNLIVRVEMIGRRGVSSPVANLRAGEVRDLPFELPLAPIALREITVTAAERCDLRSSSAATQAVWEEARKSLEVEAAVRAQRLYRFDITRFERTLDPNGRVLEEQSRFISRFSGEPFTSRPAAELARNGYLEERDGETLLFGPTGDVLLSASFLDTHCFFLRRDTRHEGEIGLAFQPVRGRRLTDIEGVLWLDEATSELRSLEFTYTRLPSRFPGGQYGGRAEFQRLESGAVIVRSWEIRSPIVRTLEQRFDGNRISSQRTVGTFVDGGEVLNIAGLRGPSTRVTPRASISGIALDSAMRSPIRDAEIRLEGTSWSTRSGPDGRFRLDELPSGRYSLSFTFRRADGWTWTSPSQDVELVRGRTLDLRLVAPPGPAGVSAVEAQLRETLTEIGRNYDNVTWQNQFRLPTDSTVLARLSGRVMDERTRRGVADVLVLIEGTNLSVYTDSLGHTPPLDLAPGTYEIRAHHEDYVTHASSFTIATRQLGTFEIRLRPRSRLD